MITSIRSIVLCDKVETPAFGAANYVGLHGATLRSPNRPGGFQVWLAIMADVDQSRSRGEIVVDAPHVKLKAPFDSTTDRALTTMAFPLIIPIDAPCELVITVTDQARRDPPFTFRWALDFTADSKAQPADLWRVQAKAAKVANEATIRGLSQQAMRH